MHTGAICRGGHAKKKSSTPSRPSLSFWHAPAEQSTPDVWWGSKHHLRLSLSFEDQFSSGEGETGHPLQVTNAVFKGSSEIALQCCAGFWRHFWPLSLFWKDHTLWMGQRTSPWVSPWYVMCLCRAFQHSFNLGELARDIARDIPVEKWPFILKKTR